MLGNDFCETCTAVGVLPSPNPWSEPSESLLSLDRISGSEILDGLAKILREWPRGNTANQSGRDRHLRFIMAVAGYPEVDIATRPLDWPLHEKSIYALGISKNLDDIVGMHEFTSLRSALLNRDLRFRIDKVEDEADMIRAHKECLLLLFARARQVDGVPLDRLNYRAEEEGLLAQIHGNDNNRRGEFWPNLEELGKYEEPLGEEPNKPDDMQKTRNETGGEGDEWDEAYEANKKWIKWRDLGGSFSLSNLEVEEVAFQFHYVQSWLDDVVPSQENLDGTVQRFLRGASQILELVSSEVRQRIAVDIGIGAITVDGGGRVVFLCPKDKIESMQRHLGESVWQFLSSIMNKDEGGERQHSRAGNHIRFERALENWANSCFEVGHRSENGREQERRDETVPDQEDYRGWFKQIQAKMPPLSIPIIQQRGEADEKMQKSISEVVDSLNGFESPKITKGENLDSPMDECLFCNNTPITGASSLDSMMGLEGRSDGLSPRICPFHRLLYHVGHDQRVSDSTLRPSPKQMDEKAAAGSSKPTTAIAQLDGNSLGIIFTERFPSASIEQLFDRKRRRSFRFNYQWWNSIQKAIDKHGKGDRVAAWITAGDDVLLAQYGWVEADEIFVGRDQKLLEETLHDLAKNLGTGVGKELPEGLFLSFAAGIAIKRTKDENDGENYRIQQQLGVVKKKEKVAKNRWKTKANSENWKMMITRSSEDIVVPDEEDHRGPGDWISGTKSNIVAERSSDPISQPIQSTDDEYRKMEIDNFEEWNEGSVKEAIGVFELDDNNLTTVTSDLMRHYVEDCADAKKLVVLPPKKKRRVKGAKLLAPVGGSRGNILQACKLDGVSEIHFLLTHSLFPTEESVKRMLFSLTDLGFKNDFSVKRIDGPETGPLGCRDSINEWREEMGDYTPDQIFVTGSTLLIVASLARLFPSAELISLRGDKVMRLPEEELASTLDPVRIEEYLALHGLELTKDKKLKLNGVELEAPPIGNCRMIGTRASITWLKGRDDQCI